MSWNEFDSLFNPAAKKGWETLPLLAKVGGVFWRLHAALERKGFKTEINCSGLPLDEMLRNPATETFSLEFGAEKKEGLTSKKAQVLAGSILQSFKEAGFKVQDKNRFSRGDEHEFQSVELGYDSKSSQWGVSCQGEISVDVYLDDSKSSRVLISFSLQA